MNKIIIALIFIFFSFWVVKAENNVWKNENKPIKVTKRIMYKYDILINNFVSKLENKYRDISIRQKVIKEVIKRLDNLKKEKPKAKYIIEYINKKLREKILEYQKILDKIKK